MMTMIMMIMMMIMIIMIIIVKDSSVRVNDGKYHVIRFTRDGVNSSLQVDDNKVSDIEIRSVCGVSLAGPSTAVFTLSRYL